MRQINKHTVYCGLPCLPRTLKHEEAAKKKKKSHTDLFSEAPMPLVWLMKTTWVKTLRRRCSCMLFSVVRVSFHCTSYWQPPVSPHIIQYGTSCFLKNVILTFPSRFLSSLPAPLLSRSSLNVHPCRLVCSRSLNLLELISTSW